VKHNHITRDIKSVGECEACDYHTHLNFKLIHIQELLDIKRSMLLGILDMTDKGLQDNPEKYWYRVNNVVDYLDLLVRCNVPSKHLLSWLMELVSAWR
jgi:hypothetical protein